MPSVPLAEVPVFKKEKMLSFDLTSLSGAKASKKLSFKAYLVLLIIWSARVITWVISAAAKVGAALFAYTPLFKYTFINKARAASLLATVADVGEPSGSVAMMAVNSLIIKSAASVPFRVFGTIL